MSNDAGTVSEGPYTYDAYGQGAPSTGVPFKYTGRRLDPETGLYYYRARYYSATLGRFLQTDPIEYQDQMNLYGYVNNDPGNATDPSGEFMICAPWMFHCDLERAFTFWAPFEPAVTFFTGIGDKKQFYGQDSYMVRSAQRSVVVDIARQRFLRNLDRMDAGGPDEYKPGVRFDYPQFALATIYGDSFSHVMGSVRVEARRIGPRKVQFTLTNELRVGSLLAGSQMPPEWSDFVHSFNREKGPLATVTVTITWTENFEKRSCAGTRIKKFSC
jgi:RHS repeat-associated protein